MPRFFVKTEQLNENKIKIQGEDVKHIKNVLRKEIGDKIEICNSETEKAYKCVISKIEEKQVIAQIIEQIQTQEDKIKIDIYQGLPKADKMELILQKSVELGANAIIPVSMKRSVVKIDSKDEDKKIQRWQKIVESAAKQSGRDSIPKVEKIRTVQEIANLNKKYNSIIVAYENEKENKLKDEIQKIKSQLSANETIKIAIVIGPEGGLEEKEVEILKQKGAQVITLGKRILRTETVALNMLSILMYELEN